MTTYVTIPNTDIDQDSPVTQPLMTALRHNPISIAEADSSVDPLLLPSVLLGTLTTTSGSTQTLSSLTLTPYKFLIATLSGVSGSSTGAFTFGGQTISNTYTVSETAYGVIFINLLNGDGMAVSGPPGVAGSAYGVNTSYTTATTSVSFGITAGLFDAGSVRIYGVK